MTNSSPDKDQDLKPYHLDSQVGFILRRASQRHLSIFSEAVTELTATQFAVLAKLCERGTLSQNALGRETAMDAATIKGVVDRLVIRNLLTTKRDQFDKRRTNVDLSPMGRALFARLESQAKAITEQTLAPLSTAEQAVFLELLGKLV